MDKEVVTHVQGGEVFSFEVSNPITEIVVTSRDESFLLTTQGITDRKSGVSAITVGREVWGIYAIS